MKSRRHDRFAPQPLRQWMQRDTPAYSFERSQRSPVYAVHCFSTGVFMSIGGKIGRLRLRREFRTPDDQAKRAETARSIAAMRRNGLHRDDVMKRHEQRLTDDTGLAVRVDIATELSAWTK